MKTTGTRAILMIWLVAVLGQTVVAQNEPLGSFFYGGQYSKKLLPSWASSRLDGSEVSKVGGSELLARLVVSLDPIGVDGPF